MNVEFHAGEFRIVRTVHTFVAEVLADFVHTFETAYDEAFQIELCCNTQIQVDIERVVVGDERTGTCSSGDRLQDGSLDFGITGFVEHGTHGRYYFGAFQECFLHTVVHDEVDIALAITQFGVFERVVGYSIFIFYDRQRLEAFGQYSQLFGMYADFAHLGTEYEAFDADKVAQVEQTFEHGVVHVFVFIGADVIAGDVYLDTSFGIL